MLLLRRILPLFLCVVIMPFAAGPAVAVDADRYQNPLKPRVPGDGTVDSCADPTVLRGQQRGDRFWYMYCTTDPLNDGDTAGSDPVTFHPIPQMRSRDLVNWKYLGDALPPEDQPEWAAEGAGIWAPDVVYSKAFDKYYMTYVVTDTDESISGEPNCNGDSAIGVATSRNPTGPWKASETPVVMPRRGGPGCNFFWTYDPDVLGDSIGAHGILYYGSYYGGMFGRQVALTRNGMTSTPAETQISIANRYEGSNVVRRGGWYYLFASATNCCNGPLTGYSVFAGRSRDPLGPYVDREGNSLLAGRVGGTPVLSMNGNRWVGAGHNSVFRDFDGQWWTIYHAVDRSDPFFESEPGFTKRPALLDPLDWKQGWPTVRAGRWASFRQMPAPAAQPGERSRYRPKFLADDRPGRPLDRFSDEFDGSSLDDDRWSWVREPDPATYDVKNGKLRVDTNGGDLTRESNSAPVLVEAAPNRRNYVMETRVRLNLPPEGCCQNFVQAGMLNYGGDDNFLKLVHVSIFETRQTEFAKEVGGNYGNTVVGTPATWTHLRVVKRTLDRPGSRDKVLYTAYTSQDGRRWVRGGTWTHRLGDNDKIGLVSMGGTGFTAKFDYVRVSSLARR